MSFPPDDDFDDAGVTLTQEEIQAQREGTTVTAKRTGARRSAADDVLDLVGGTVRPAPQRDLRFCPLCRSATKVRSNDLQGGTTVRRCTNPKCRNEYPVATHSMQVATPPPFPDPMIHGGPYPVGPSRGGSSMPAIDPNQPIARRLSEFARRINHDGE